MAPDRSPHHNCHEIAFVEAHTLPTDSIEAADNRKLPFDNMHLLHSRNKSCSDN